MIGVKNFLGLSNSLNGSNENTRKEAVIYEKEVVKKTDKEEIRILDKFWENKQSRKK